VRNFFRKGNLMALRELALRRTADRVDDEMLPTASDLAIAGVADRERAAAAASARDEALEKLVRSAARWRRSSTCPGTASMSRRRPAAPARRGASASCGAAEAGRGLGATTATCRRRTRRGGREVRARAQPVARRAGPRHRASPGGRGRTLADAVAACWPDLDVIRSRCRRGARAAAGRPAGRPTTPTRRARREAWRATWERGDLRRRDAAGRAAAAVLDLANIVMLFLLAVVLRGRALRPRPAVLARFLNVARSTSSSCRRAFVCNVPTRSTC
jgi:two-component system sensor histidine kinase KdpD